MEKLNSCEGASGSIKEILIEAQQKPKFKMVEGTHAVNFTIQTNKEEEKEFKNALKKLNGNTNRK